MNSKNIAITVLFLISSFIGFSQKTMSDYSYIEVPEVYEFLQKKDQYQLNSLTKFLFNKYGFNAYFSNELPNVKKCDGLYADLETHLGFTYTKIVVVVKDCNGVELYRSAEGRSKLKDYKKTYHQALRNAFASFEGLGVAQKKLDVTDASIAPATSVNGGDMVTPGHSSNVYVPTARFSGYASDGMSYLLRKTASGYSLFQEVIGVEDDLVRVGTLAVENGNVMFEDVNGSVSKAYFDTNLSLFIKLPSGDKKYELVAN